MGDYSCVQTHALYNHPSWLAKTTAAPLIENLSCIPVRQMISWTLNCYHQRPEYGKVHDANVTQHA